MRAGRLRYRAQLVDLSDQLQAVELGKRWVDIRTKEGESRPLPGCGSVRWWRSALAIRTCSARVAICGTAIGCFTLPACATHVDMGQSW